MATPACIRLIHGEIIKLTELEIDKQYRNSDGMTVVGFIDPDAYRTYLTNRGDSAGKIAIDRRTLTAD